MGYQKASKPVHFSQADLIKPVLAYFENRAVPVEKYLMEAGISPLHLRDSAAPIPRSLIFRFVNAICVEEGIEDIGLEVGQATSLRMMGEFGAMLLAAKTIGDYLQRGCHLITAASSGDYYWLVEEGRQTLFCASVLGLDEEDAVQNYLYILLSTINTIREARGDDWTPERIAVPAIKPESAARVAAIFPDSTITREGKYASFPISGAMLALPMRSTTRPAQGIKSSLPYGFQASFTQLLETLVATGHSDLRSAADATGVSPRTLQRKLADCGINFTDMVVNTRIRMAARWIRESDRSLNDIARSLGYSDPANFSRAFRRLTGISPRVYRKRYADSANGKSTPACLRRE